MPRAIGAWAVLFKKKEYREGRDWCLQRCREGEEQTAFFSLKAKPGTLPITQINLHQPETLIIAGSFLTWQQQTSNRHCQTCKTTRLICVCVCVCSDCLCLPTVYVCCSEDQISLHFPSYSNKGMAARQRSHITSHQPSWERARDIEGQRERERARESNRKREGKEEGVWRQKTVLAVLHKPAAQSHCSHLCGQALGSDAHQSQVTRQVKIQNPAVIFKSHCCL